jgi:hypothetical protein
MESFRRWQGQRQLKPLRALSAGAVTPTGSKEVALEVVRSCRDRSTYVESYRSDIILQEVDNPEVVHWEVESIRPNRFWVWQESWLDHKEVYDEWIMLGEDLYMRPLWHKSDSPHFRQLTKTFALEVFLDLLDSVRGHECFTYKHGKRLFLRLDADGMPPILIDPDSSDIGPPDELATILWIDDFDRLPAKIEASARFQVEGATGWVKAEQVFYDFDAHISISAPEVEMEPIETEEM